MNQPKRILNASRKYTARHPLSNTQTSSDAEEDDGWMKAHKPTSKSTSLLAFGKYNDDSEDDDLRLDQMPRSAKKKQALGKDMVGSSSSKKNKKVGRKKKNWGDGCDSSSSDSDDSTIIGSGGTISSERSVEQKNKGKNYRLSTHSSSVKKKKSTGIKFDNTAFISSAQSKQKIDMGKAVVEKKIKQKRNSISKKTLNAVRGAGVKGGMAFHAPTSDLRSLAETKANRAPIPEDITIITQLQWHRIRLSSTHKTPIKPCRVLSRGEAIQHLRQNNQNKTNDMMEVIQYLTIRPGENSIYKCVNKSDLIPFGFTARDGISTTINEDYLQRYMNQESKTTSSSDLEAMQLYLKRVFNHAREMQRMSRERADKDLADYLNDSDSSSSSSDEEEDNDRKASVLTKKLATSSRVQFEVMEHSDDDDGEADDDNEMEDLEIPYTQAITFDPDDFGGPASEDETSNEPIRPGDVIEYYSPIFVAGDSRGLRQATVMSVRPKDETPLILDNGEFLPNTTKVKRIKVLSEGELLDHPGIYRPIYRFKLIKRGTATAADAVRKEANRLGNIMKKNLSKLQEKAEADGFAPMDMIRIGGKTRNDRTEPPRAQPPAKAKPKVRNNGRDQGESPLLSSSSEESSSENESLLHQETKPKQAAKKKSITATAATRTAKVIDNKENNGTAPDKTRISKRFSLGSLSSSAASLGSSLASSDDDSSIGSSAPRVSLGKNHTKITQAQNSVSVGKKKKGNAKPKARGMTVDLSLSSSDDEDESSVDLPPKKMGNKKPVASPLQSPCKSVNSESSLETPNSKGLIEKASSKSLTIGSSKRRVLLGSATKDCSKRTSPALSSFGGKESAKKADRRNEETFSLSSSSSDEDDDSLASIKHQSKRPAKAAPNAFSRKKEPPPSQDSVSVQIVENKSKSKIAAKKRPSPSSDLSSSDESEGDIPLSRLTGDKASKKQQLEYDKPRDRPSEKESLSTAKFGAANTGGWTEGKEGWMKSGGSNTPGRPSGFGIRRVK